MQIAASSGVCEICHQPKVQVEGNSQCIFCAGKSAPAHNAMVVSVQDPGEEELNRLLAKSGVAAPKASDVSKPEPIKPVISKVQNVVPERTIVTQNVTFEDEIKRAIDLLQKLPMPKDIKQFKAVNKAVKTLESILGVK